MAAITLKSGTNTFQPMCFARGRFGDLYGVNGIDTGIRWDGKTTAAEQLGITGPAAAPTVTTPVGGAATAGDYLVAYQYLDDTLPEPWYSPISTTATVTAALNDSFSWDTIAGSSEARVYRVRLWRSTSGEADVLYKIIDLGNSGAITSGANSGGFIQFVLPTGHGLVTGAKFVASGTGVAGYNTTHTVTAYDATHVTTNQAYSADSTGGTWILSGYTLDTASDATISAAANDYLAIYKPNGEDNATRFVPPPDFTPFIEAFQDRMWYFGAVRYSAGTVSTTSGSTTVSGTSTAWTSQMAGRYLYIAGHTTPLVIASATATSITTTSAATATLNGVAYVIAPDPTYRNSIFYSEVDEPESVPLTNVVVMQENTGDDDEVTGGKVFASRLIIAKERHLYALSFNRQPNIDANVHLLAHRGAFNNRCLLAIGDSLYGMDWRGPYRLVGGALDEQFGDEARDYWNDGTVDLSLSKWFFVTVDYSRSMVYFHVQRTDLGYSATRPLAAFAYSIDTGEWTCDLYSLPVGHGCQIDISGSLYRVLGCESGRIVLSEKGYCDFVTAAIRNTASSCTSTKVNDTVNNPFTSQHLHLHVAIIDGTGKGQYRRITTVNSASQITVSPAFSPVPDNTSVYAVGAITGIYKTGLLEIPRSENRGKKSLRLIYLPTTNDLPLALQVFENHKTTARSAKVAQNMGEGITTIANNNMVIIDPRAARSPLTTQAGFAEFPFSQMLDDRSQALRWMAFQLWMFGATESMMIYQIEVDGMKDS